MYEGGTAPSRGDLQADLREEEVFYWLERALAATENLQACRLSPEAVGRHVAMLQAILLAGGFRGAIAELELLM